MKKFTFGYGFLLDKFYELKLVDKEAKLNQFTFF
jgi:hypothetical protein